ncbi:MAG: hypothetical protein U1G05_03215 [Kiritimatiellia bacterium]
MCHRLIPERPGPATAPAAAVDRTVRWRAGVRWMRSFVFHFLVRSNPGEVYGYETKVSGNAENHAVKNK